MFIPVNLYRTGMNHVQICTVKLFSDQPSYTSLKHSQDTTTHNNVSVLPSLYSNPVLIPCCCKVTCQIQGSFYSIQQYSILW